MKWKYNKKCTFKNAWRINICVCVFFCWSHSLIFSTPCAWPVHTTQSAAGIYTIKKNTGLKLLWIITFACEGAGGQQRHTHECMRAKKKNMIFNDLFTIPPTICDALHYCGRHTILYNVYCVDTCRKIVCSALSVRVETKCPYSRATESTQDNIVCHRILAARLPDVCQWLRANCNYSTI